MRAVATPERLAPSRRLRTAAEAERERVGRELGRLDSRAQQLHRELEQLDLKRVELREQLALLARISGSAEDSPFPQASTPDKVAHLQAVQPGEPEPKAILRGARIREIAVLLLASSPTPSKPIHYQEWFALFRDAGYAVRARDPLGTFLTQITRSPVVRKAGAPGVYALDFEAPLALRKRLHDLESELARTAAITESTVDAAAARERRSRLKIGRAHV